MRAKVVGGKYWYQYRGPGDGVGFHYDKDEGMASDQMIMRFPMYSTVTYIAPKGAPTIILNQTIIKNGNVEVPAVPDQAWFVYPKVNKVRTSTTRNVSSVVVARCGGCSCCSACFSSCLYHVVRVVVLRARPRVVVCSCGSSFLP